MADLRARFKGTPPVGLKRVGPMYCPVCGAQGAVIDSHDQRQGTVVVRRRRCLACRYSWSSEEHPALAGPEPHEAGGPNRGGRRVSGARYYLGFRVPLGSEDESDECLVYALAHGGSWRKLYLRQGLRYHSPTGFNWGSAFKAGVRFGVAVSAQEQEALGVRPQLGQLDAPAAPGVPVAPVPVVEVQRRGASVVAAVRAGTPEAGNHVQALPPLNLPPALLTAAGADLDIAAPAGIAQTGAALPAGPGRSSVNAGADVGSGGGEPPSAVGTAQLGETGLAVGGLPISPVRDADTTGGAVQGRVRTHGTSPVGRLPRQGSVSSGRMLPDRGDGRDAGEAELARHLLMHACGKPSLAERPDLYQEFKAEVVAKMAKIWMLDGDFIRGWVAEHDHGDPNAPPA